MQQDNMSVFTVGSLFAGIGGIDIAFMQAGFEIAFANEMDKAACITYRNNFPGCNLVEDDIRSLDAKTLPDVDVIAAGFPCQPFSICGKQQGFNDKRGNLFFEIMRIVDAKKPRIIFLENVANLVDHDNGRTFNVIHNELASRDYYIRYLVADAWDYGIPQHRTRTYLLAFDNEKDCNAYRFPEKCELTARIFDLIDRTKKAPNEFYLNKSSWQYQKMSKVIIDDNQIYRFSDYGTQSSKDGICFTLKANMGTWHDRVPIIKDAFGIRKITPQECLALQGFPNDSVFKEITVEDAYKQCGNTVCVPVVKRVAERIIKIMR